MGAIADRVSKQPGGGKALFFEKPTGKAMPVAMNVFGSLKRMELALGWTARPGSGCHRRPHREAGARGHAQARLGLLRKAGQAAGAGRGGQLDAQDRQAGALPGGGSPGRPGAALRPARAHHLARGWRPLHHPGPEPHPQQADRPPQRGPLPPAGLR
ncbi:MAG: UbiD family decarboxylase [Holophagaceae bacterium]|uniref:UbiD family decarboxylase n=1 Tax=Candidatus Geothrix skivensis TaxID=2954439 RepID=A0A9D7XJV9_9BACT|nr:UbiD family decarboxylase [Candidatus Geothrix skivensis]